MKPQFPHSVVELASDGDHQVALSLIEKIMAKLSRECEHCGFSNKRLKACICGAVRYCSVMCQKLDFKKHKVECRGMIEKKLQGSGGKI